MIFPAMIARRALLRSLPAAAATHKPNIGWIMAGERG